ncbi:MAG: hypothetical protein M0Z41_20370 [Peptococcaceae bacterium]|nr:hypothetical protein [Peptococcaceae bacterium]
MSKEVIQLVMGRSNAGMPILKTGEQAPIPVTTPNRYITGIPALNLPAPEGTTGDWHWSTVFYNATDNNRHAIPLQLAGEGESLDTRHIYGQYGIYECSKAMMDIGLDIPKSMSNVYAANHFRAILDMLYWSLIKYHRVIALDGVTEDWLDSQEQKEFVLKKAAEMLPFLNNNDRDKLQDWISQERLPGYRSELP